MADLENSKITQALMAPRGGIQVSFMTNGVRTQLAEQLVKLIRKYFDRIIGGPDIQYARVSTDSGGFKTYLDHGEYQSLNPVEQVFCRPATSTTPRPDHFERVCYICGFKLMGKNAIRSGYTNTNNPTNYTKDWRYPQIEHVMNMMDGTTFGVVTPKGKRGFLHKSTRQDLNYPDYVTDSTPSDKLKELEKIPPTERNKWPVQWYEYLWSHLLCNQIKGDKRFVRIDFNDNGIPKWVINSEQVIRTQDDIKKKLKQEHENKPNSTSLTEWVDKSNIWWNTGNNQLDKYLGIFASRLTDQNMGTPATGNHKWTPSPAGTTSDYSKYGFDSNELKKGQVKVIPSPNEMWEGLDKPPQRKTQSPEFNKKRALRWIKKKLDGKQQVAINRAIIAFLSDGTPAPPSPGQWSRVEGVPVELRREVFLELPRFNEIYNISTEGGDLKKLLLEIYGDGEKAEPSAVFTNQPAPSAPFLSDSQATVSVNPSPQHRQKLRQTQAVTPNRSYNQYLSLESGGSMPMTQPDEMQQPSETQQFSQIGGGSEAIFSTPSSRPPKQRGTARGAIDSGNKIVDFYTKLANAETLTREEESEADKKEASEEAAADQRGSDGGPRPGGGDGGGPRPGGGDGGGGGLPPTSGGPSFGGGGGGPRPTSGGRGDDGQSPAKRSKSAVRSLATTFLGTEISDLYDGIRGDVGEERKERFNLFKHYNYNPFEDDKDYNRESILGRWRVWPFNQ